MRRYFNYEHKARGAYILTALEKYLRNGDAYFASEADAFRICQRKYQNVSLIKLKADFDYLLENGDLVFEGSRLYLYKVQRYEDFVASELTSILPHNVVPTHPMVDMDVSAGVRLNELQKEAIQMARSHHLSLILGGAGSGKTTLIQALCLEYFVGGKLVLAAPTGKAARNLTERTGLPARTVHSALGKIPDEDFLDPVKWSTIRMVVVDEASMLSLELFAGLLSKLPANCSLVLVGDPNQLGSVGTGNLIPELLELGCPVTRLEQQYRQSDNESALFYNVTNFPKLFDSEELKFDDSFKLIPANESDIFKVVQEEAAKRHLAGENVQVIAPTRDDVKRLNEQLQQVVNPPADGKPEVTHNGITIRENDRTMILKNNREERCFNGDIGAAHVEPLEGGAAFIHVPLSANRKPKFYSAKIGSTLALAYALTVHKSQGSQYDTVIMPASTDCQKMLRRNLFYTAISRAKKQVILVGCKEALHIAMVTPPEPRKSMLVTKTHQKMHFAA